MGLYNTDISSTSVAGWQESTVTSQHVKWPHNIPGKRNNAASRKETAIYHNHEKNNGIPCDWCSPITSTRGKGHARNTYHGFNHSSRQAACIQQKTVDTTSRSTPRLNKQNDWDLNTGAGKLEMKAKNLWCQNPYLPGDNPTAVYVKVYVNKQSQNLIINALDFNFLLSLLRWLSKLRLASRLMSSEWVTPRFHVCFVRTTRELLLQQRGRKLNTKIFKILFYLTKIQTWVIYVLERTNNTNNKVTWICIN